MVVVEEGEGEGGGETLEEVRESNGDGRESWP